MRKSFLARWRSSFLTGLAVVLPAVISVALLVWLFSTVSNITDTLLFPLRFFLDKDQIHKPDGMTYWYWKLVAFVLAIALITAAGVVTRYYLGKKIIEWVDTSLLRVPLLNKIYGAMKQVNDAFSNKKSAFRTVVLIEFPRAGSYSMGFITSEVRDEVQANTKEKLVCVFIPTTPNPTSGFMMLVPEKDVTKLDMSVAEGIKYIVSLGSIVPEYEPPGKKLKR